MNENEYRVQDEYFAIEENWPQPKDNKVTLEQEGYMGEAPTKKKPAMTAKKKRKLSESLAGMTAAAVAVIMVSTSMPGLKDLKDDLVKPSVGEPCPVCGSAYCEFWDSEQCYSGLRLSFEGERPFAEFDYYEMNGFTDADEDGWETETAIFLDGGRRAVLRFHDWEVTEGYRTHTGHRDSRGGDTDTSGQLNFVSREIELEDGKSGERVGNYIVQLLYAPDGNLPERGYEVSEEMLEALGENYDYCAIPMGEDGRLELRIYTDLGASYCEEALDVCEVEIVERTDQIHELGETMIFIEDGSRPILRTWSDMFHGGCTTSRSVYKDTGNTSQFFSFFGAHKTYVLDIEYDVMQVCFVEEDWFKLMDQWEELNAKALRTGHDVSYEVKDIGDIEMNRIDYTVYFAWTVDPRDSVNNQHFGTYFFVPKHEPNIALIRRLSMHADEIAEIIEGVGVGALTERDLLALEYICLQDDVGYVDQDSSGNNNNQQQASSVCTVCGSASCEFFLREGTASYSGLRVSMAREIEARVHNILSMKGLATEDTEWSEYTVLHGAAGERVLLRIDLTKVPECERTTKITQSIYLEEKTKPAQKDTYTGQQIYLYDVKGDMRGNIIALLVYGYGDTMPAMDFGLPDGFSLDKLEYKVYPIDGVENVELRVYTDWVGSGILSSATDFCETEILIGMNNRFELGDTMYLNEDVEAGVLRSWDDFSPEYGFIRKQSAYSNRAGQESIAFFEMKTPVQGYGVLSDYRANRVVCLEDSWLTFISNWEVENRKAIETGHEAFFSIEKVGEMQQGDISYDAYLAWIKHEHNTYDVTRIFVPRQEQRIAFLVHESGYEDHLTELRDPSSLSELDIGLQLLFDHIELR